jgi:FkbM family methyltransferase
MSNINYIPIISREGKVINLIFRNNFLQLRMVSYTDTGEDVIFNYVFRDVKNVFYIDVGANDPWFCSATKWLYDSGRGNGINIEPLKREYNLLCEDRPKDINLNVAVGNEECEMILYSNFSISTFRKDYTIIEHYSADRFVPIKVPVTTLKLICDKHLAKNQTIHFLKIDVEGFERQVLIGSDLKKYRPWIIMLEATTIKNIPVHEEWEHILIENDYIFAKQYSVNRFYIAKEKIFLQDRFLDMEIFYKRLIILDADYNKYLLHS